MYKVFINPGHMPGVDPGAVNKYFGITEADVVHEIGILVSDYLNQAGCEAVVVQSDNLAGENPQYDNVCATANTWPADLFVSIHCNAFNGSAGGTETCVYSYGGNSAKLAECIQQQIVNSVDTIDRGIKERPGLIVLKKTNMPAVLVETAFIDNEHDAQILMEQKEEIARAIARGVTDYLSGL